MMEPLISKLKQRYATMLGERAQWESHWSEIERRVSPRGDVLRRPAVGGRRTEYIFESTATLGLERFAAAMVGLVAPQGQRWHTLTTTDRRLMADIQVQRYLEEVNDLLFDYRYSASSGFSTNLFECMIQLGSLGTAPIYIEDQPASGISYRAMHITECCIDVDHQGRVDTVGREFDWTARQAKQKWGIEALPRQVREALDKPDRKFTFCQMIAPRADYDPNRMDAKGKRWGSWFWLKDSGDAIIAEGGFNTMPIPVARYTTAPRENYGRSPAMMVLPDIKMINEMAKTVIRSAHRNLDPPLLTADDGVLTRIQTRPGAINIGGLNSRGDQMVRPLQTGGSLPEALELQAQTRQTIKDAFFVSLFQSLVDAPDRMTATEVLERMRERGVLLAPAAGRIETELLEPLITRELDIHARAGRLPPMPEALARAGGDVKVVYQNPMSRAAKAEEATGFFQLVNAITPLAASEPEILDALDMPAAVRGIASIIGVPARWMRSVEEAKARADQRTQAAQVQQLAAAAPAVAGATLDLARAEQLGGGLEAVI
ncbi:MAG: portal protein [Sandarakinorhabdus sp.]|jgi:hypothetical protein|nr:portal protein [Sandarakinorhabdus sp.]